MAVKVCWPFHPTVQLGIPADMSQGFATAWRRSVPAESTTGPNFPGDTRVDGFFDIPPGSDLFSHSVSKAVSSALGRFTTVFGMDTGGATPLEPPGSTSIEPVCTNFHNLARSASGVFLAARSLHYTFSRSIN